MPDWWPLLLDPIYIGVEIGARIILAVLGICIHYKVPVFQRRVHEKDWPDYSYPYAEQQMFPEATATGALIAIVCLSLVTGITVVFFAGKWPAKLCLEESILYVLGKPNIFKRESNKSTESFFGSVRSFTAKNHAGAHPFCSL